MIGAAVVLVAGPGSAPAQDLQSQLSSKQGQLDQANQKQGVLTTTISHYNARISDLTAQVATLRNREAQVQSDLQAKQNQLAVATAKRKREQVRLARLKVQLKRSIKVLKQRLVAIYKSSEPDTITVILQANGFNDLLERTTYLERIQSQDSSMVGRVRDLRNQARASYQRLKALEGQIRAARDEIAAKQHELARTRGALQGQQSSLVSARSAKQGALASVKDQAQELEGDIGDIQAQLQAQLAASSGPTLPAGPIRSGSAGLIWPVNGPVVSPFGWRFGGGEFHRGIDIAVPTGTPIRAAKAGVVVQAGPYDGYGNFTCINHGGGLSTCYAHQESFAVSAGQNVSQGQVIGYTDCTGYCFGPHVHFEVRINGTAVDPMGYL